MKCNLLALKKKKMYDTKRTIIDLKKHGKDWPATIQTRRPRNEKAKVYKTQLSRKPRPQ